MRHVHHRNRWALGHSHATHFAVVVYIVEFPVNDLLISGTNVVGFSSYFLVLPSIDEIHSKVFVFVYFDHAMLSPTSTVVYDCPQSLR